MRIQERNANDSFVWSIPWNRGYANSSVFVPTDDLHAAERFAKVKSALSGRTLIQARRPTVSSSVIDFAKRTNAIDPDF